MMVPETGLDSKNNALLFACVVRRMVPETGLEPARIAAYAPKAYVYTSFTTRAY